MDETDKSPKQTGSTPTNLTETTFASLGLDESLQKGLDDAGFTHCTPIQAKTLPIALTGKDVAGQAQTGTGKTIAFLLAAMQKMLNEPSDKYPRTVVLAPTRELALQIYDDAKVVGKHTDFNYACLIGGTSYDTQKAMLEKGADIVIATPGRLIDFFKQRLLNFHAVQVVVLDEADRMFDMGFIKDIRFLLNRMPEPNKRQGLLFSATLSYKVTELAYSHMNEPVKMEVAPETKIASGLTEVMYFPANNEKEKLLVGLMQRHQPTKSVVFVNTKREGERIWARLKGNGFNAVLLSGDVPQKKRVRLLEQFKSEDTGTLVATDVAARGLHIDDVTHVFNYDLPQDCEDYVHRIGRTARAGQKGEAISFACENYSFSIPDIEEYIGHKIPVEKIAANDLAADLQPGVKIERRKPREQDKRGANKGGRGQKPRGKPRHSGQKNRSQSQSEEGAGKNRTQGQKSRNLRNGQKRTNAHSENSKQNRNQSRNQNRNQQRKRPEGANRKPQRSQQKQQAPQQATAKRPWWKKMLGMD